jgi:hypothetical protein
MPILLVVMTHNVTGLKYLCKVSGNLSKYFGSGKDWKIHLKQYGKNIKKEVIKKCDTMEDFQYWGRWYSQYYNVVNAVDDFGYKIWANKIPETGGGPGRSGHHKGENNPMYGRERNDLKSEYSPNKSEYRRKQNSETSKLMWSNLEHRLNQSEKRKQLWTDTDYIEKMKCRKKTNKKVEVNGIIYSSLKEAADHLNIHPSTVSKRCSSLCEKFTNWRYIT